MQTEYMEGVITGSMAKEDRRTSGVEAEIAVGMVAWRIVTGRRLGEMEKEGSRESEGQMVRGGAEVGVTTSRVLIKSRGARVKAAIAEAATATAREKNGFGLSIMSSPPRPPADIPIGSGTLRRAESMLLVQLSVVLRRKL